MIHSNKYIHKPKALQNSAQVVMKMAIEALPYVDIFLSVTGNNVLGNVLTLTFTTASDYVAAVMSPDRRFVQGAPLMTVQLALLLNNVDYSDYLVDQLNITWGEDNNGTCSFTLKKIRPFSTIPVRDADNEVKVGSTVQISSVVTLGEDQWTHKIFTGYISNFDYDMWADTVAIECLDNSFSISRLSKKISQEFYNLDPYVTETLKGPPTVVTLGAMSRIIYSLQKVADLNVKPQVSGLWLASDTTLTTNLLSGQPDNAVFLREDDGFSYLHLERNNMTADSTLLTTLTTNPNVALIARYAIAETEQQKLEATPIKKSSLLKQIAKRSGIEDMVLVRQNMPEDEDSHLAYTANNEFPLDFIRKVITPQTWRAYFDETGSLIVDREIMAAVPSTVFTDDFILENTLKITQDLDSVINVQEVGGITVVQPSNGGDPTPTSPPNKGGTTCKEITLLNAAVSSSGGAFTVGKNPTQAQLDSCFVFYHTQIDLRTIDLFGGSVVRGGVIPYIRLSDGNRFGAADGMFARNTSLHVMAGLGLPRPQLYAAPMAMQLNNSYAGLNSSTAVVLLISGRSPALRSQYGLSFSGLPSTADVAGSCFASIVNRTSTGCIACGAGTYEIAGSPHLIGVAVSVLRPLTVDTSTGNVTVGTFSAHLEIRTLVKLS